MRAWSVRCSAARRPASGPFWFPRPQVANANQGQAYVLATKKRLETLRAAAGADCDFVLDGGNRLTPGDAQMVSAAIERFHVLWFNEPCPLTNLAALKKLAGENVTPIGIGRHVRECSAIQDLLREDAVDIIRPDIGLNGISQIRRMAAIAETYYVAVGPTHDGGPIGTAAALHLAASLPNFFIQQIPLPEADEDRRMRLELTAAPVEIVKDGFAELPVGPGLGITVNEQALEKYAEAAHEATRISWRCRRRRVRGQSGFAGDCGCVASKRLRQSQATAPGAQAGQPSSDTVCRDAVASGRVRPSAVEGQDHERQGLRRHLRPRVGPPLRLRQARNQRRASSAGAKPRSKARPAR